MSFLIRTDLESTLNQDDVTTLAPTDDLITQFSKRSVEEVKTYIQHRYDPALIFIDILLFETNTAYVIGDFIYDNSSKFYTCIQENTGQPLTNTDYFTEGDTRNSDILDITSIIAIYKLFRKVQPRTVPEWISSEYEMALDKLKEYQKGTRTILLPVKVDADGEEEGHRITYGVSEEQRDWEF